MSATGAILVQDALCQRGILADNVAPTSDQLAVGLRFLNRMLRSWGQETEMVYVISSETFTMTPGVATYLTSLFASGNGRPNAIDSLTLVLSNVTYPCTLIDNQTYNDITYKSTQAVPTMCYYDANFPDATFHFYPTPYAAFTCNVDCLSPLSSTDIAAATVVYMPDGYEKAIVDNLSVYLNYGNPPTPQMIKDANDSRNILKRRNFQPLLMETGINSGYSVNNDFPYRGF